jgi:uncharacterized protein YbbK (DUF523 family)
MIMVSACLAGYPCRYDGTAQTNSEVQKLVQEGKALPVCPEQLGGLTTPRAPAEIRNGRVISKSGQDVTEVFKNGAEIVCKLAERYGCTAAILKARSPSCGKGHIYDGTFSGTIVSGDGIATAALAAQGIDVRSEEDL